MDRRRIARKRTDLGRRGRSRWRQLLMGALVAGAVVSGTAAFAPRLAGADDEAPRGEGIEWASGLAAGQARAEKESKLLFVYFGRHAPR